MAVLAHVHVSVSISNPPPGDQFISDGIHHFRMGTDRMPIPQLPQADTKAPSQHSSADSSRRSGRSGTALPCNGCSAA